MFNYRPGFIPSTFIVVGAGGTGSRLVPLLCQFLKTINWIPDPKIYIIDHDTVEDKNLARQNFIKLDLNKSKAVVLADRYGKAFDLNITPIVSKVENYTGGAAPFILDKGASELNIAPTQLAGIRNAIVVMCVDSVKARLDILSHVLYREAKNVLVLDSGNENDFGQVLVYNDTTYQTPPASVTTPRTRKDWEALQLPGMGIPYDFDVPCIPFPTDFYENMTDTENKSCAELDQTLAINATMATAMMGLIQNFIFSKPLSYHKLNISLTHGAIPEYITYKYIMDTTFEKKRQNKTKLFVGLSVELLYQTISKKMVEHGKKAVVDKEDAEKETKKKRTKKAEAEV
jgi:tRNA A37 threonylcarbamoyladenosine dehydratase